MQPCWRDNTVLIILLVILYALNHSHFREGEVGAWWGCKAECMCLEAEAVLIKVNPATREERSMQAYWSRPLGCGECLAGKDSLVRSLTLIHWTLIRMALPGLDASVITAFVSRSPPSPILSPTFFSLFHYCCSTWAISPDSVHHLLEETNSQWIWEFGFAAKLYLIRQFVVIE